MFKVGDVVECVNSENTGGYLTLGQNYVVCPPDLQCNADEPYTMVLDNDENPSWFYTSRFRRVEKVKTNPCRPSTEDCMQHYISEQINVVIDTNARKILIDMAKIIGYNVVENEPQPKYSLVKLVKAQ